MRGVSDRRHLTWQKGWGFAVSIFSWAPHRQERRCAKEDALMKGEEGILTRLAIALTSISGLTSSYSRLTEGMSRKKRRGEGGGKGQHAASSRQARCEVCD